MHDTGCSGLVHWDDPKGWQEEGGGSGFRMGNTCTPMVDSSQCMAKPIQYYKVKKERKKIVNSEKLEGSIDFCFISDFVSEKTNTFFVSVLFQIL